MSNRRRTECIEHYIKNILEGNDEKMRHLSTEYKNYHLSTIKTLNFSRETFSMGVEMISKRLFALSSDSTPYIMSLLVFSNELNTFYKVHHYSWYTTDMLVQTLVHILLKTQFNHSNNRCIILYPCFLSYFPPHCLGLVNLVMLGVAIWCIVFVLYN